MSTESLMVKLQADTDDLEKGLNRVDKDLNDVSKSTGKADKSMAALGSTAKAAAGIALGFAAAAAASATALSAVVVSAAKSRQELSLLSGQAKLSIADFESLSFATEQYGLSAENVADISKDLSDKMGEFGKAGTGAFQDYADVIGITKEEAQAAAIEFENMSSDQVLGEMVRKMEESGASANEMTFVMESMGNEASRLIPLFANNSKELDTLRKRYDDATKSLNLTNAQAKDLQQTATDFDLAMDVMTKSGTAVVSKLAPTLSSFFNGIIDVVPDATQSIINFINSFLKAEEIKSIAELNVQIEESAERTKELNAEREKWINSDSNMKRVQNTAKMSVAALNVEIKEQEQRTKELLEQKEKLAAQEMADAERLSGGTISADGGGLASSGGTGDEIEALMDRFKTEEELLTKQYEKEVSRAAGHKGLLLNLEKEYQENLKKIADEAQELADEKAQEAAEEVNGYAEMLMTKEELRKHHLSMELEQVVEAADVLAELEAEKREQGLIDEQEYQDRLAEIRNAADNKTSELTKNYEDGNKDKESSDEAYLNSAISIGQTLGKENEAIQAATIVATTAAGISRQFADLPFPAALATSAAIAISGAAQLASIGSGSISGSSSSTPADTTTTEPDIIVSNNDTSGQTQNLVISFDESGDLGALGAFLNTATNKAIQDGLV